MVRVGSHGLRVIPCRLETPDESIPQSGITVDPTITAPASVSRSTTGELRSGTLNVPGIVGLGRAAEICRLEMAEESARLGALRDRLLAGVDPSIGPIYEHGAVARLTADYRATGVPLPPTRYAGGEPRGHDWSRALIVAPPSAHGTPWMRRCCRSPG